MPIHLGPLSRRELLGRALVGAGALALPSTAWSLTGTDRNRFALFSDTHVSEIPSAASRGVTMSENLRKAVAEVVALERKPSGVLITGDCAYLEGLPGDYTQLVDLLRPVRAQDLPVHFLLGNHDHRANFRSGAAEASDRPVLESKHVSLVKTPRANLFMLDSLDRVNVTPGLLGAEQLEWLRRSLDRNSNRPAMIFVHHQPNFAEFGTVGGLTDTDPFFKLIESQTHVKAVFFGHTHNWLVKERAGIHFVNLPPVAYVFNPANPSGWVDLEIQDYSATITLLSLDKSHKAHGEARRLSWR